MNRLYRNILLIIATTLSTLAHSQSLPADSRLDIADMLTRIVSREVLGGSVKVDRTRAAGDKVEIYASIGLSYYPFREDNVQAIYDSVRMLLPTKYYDYNISIITDNHRIEELIPIYYRSKNRNAVRFTNTSSQPLVRPLSAVSKPEEGLSGRHIAMWQSHGRYFEQDENLWRWQRSRLWETVEDLFTQSFVLPYLVPMLENAGANVLLPRERDTQTHEIIIDNDEGIDQGRVVEHNGDKSWGDAGSGFAHKRDVYLTGQNPFREGSARSTETITSGDESRIEWHASIPEDGEYAVYVSYKSSGDKSTSDATYTVHHAGGQSRYAVNQQMGGGMWVYLGHFSFRKGDDKCLVSLSNKSTNGGKTISADAVKIGGGYGNIARKPSAKFQKEDIIYEATTSEYPRFCEGSRYWLQWSGFEEDVYTPKENLDDYKDDYMSRAHWVNALMGGSERLPKEEGKNIPVDMVLASE